VEEEEDVLGGLPKSTSRRRMTTSAYAIPAQASFKPRDGDGPEAARCVLVPRSLLPGMVCAAHIEVRRFGACRRRTLPNAGPRCCNSRLAHLKFEAQTAK